MTDGTRPGFTPNLVVGVALTALGILLTMDRLGLVMATAWLRFWPVLLVLFGAAIVAQALRPRQPGEGRPAPILSAPLVILLVVVGVIANRTSPARGASVTDGSVGVHAVMSGNRYTVTGNFEAADTTAVMGHAELDLRQSALAPGEIASVNVVTVMGQTIVYVPADWIVTFDAVPVMGSVEDERGRRARNNGGDNAGGASASIDTPAAAGVSGGAAPADTPGAVAPPTEPPVSAAAPSEPRPRLVVRGFVLMGGIVVRS